MRDLIEGRARWWRPTGLIPLAADAEPERVLSTIVANDPSYAGTIETDGAMAE